MPYATAIRDSLMQYNKSAGQERACALRCCFGLYPLPEGDRGMLPYMQHYWHRHNGQLNLCADGSLMSP